MIHTFVVVLAALFTGTDYPDAKRVQQTDVYHGVSVEDPYRWLENDVRVDPEVDAWVDAQNVLTGAHLSTLAHRDAIQERLEVLWDYPKYRTPLKAGGRYYVYENDGLQNQDVLYTMDSIGGDQRVLLDPNTWSEDGTIAMGGTSFSDDGRYMAYAIADAGSDWKTWKIRDLATNADLPESIEWSKFTTPAWMPDGSAFFYGRYATPEDGAAFQNANEFMKLYRHVPGTPQSADTLVLEDKEHARWSWGTTITEDGRWMVINVWRGAGPPNTIKIRNLETPDAPFIDLVPEWTNEYEFVGSDGDNLYFMTDEDAPRKRVITADVTDPTAPVWSEAIPEQDATLKSVSHINSGFVANYMQDATTRLKRFDMNGSAAGEIKLPGLGTSGISGGRSDDTETFYSFSSFTTPPSTYHYDFKSGTATLLKQSEVEFDPADYAVQQVFYPSKDGTKIPM
ncbi:MAG: hypothetical protein P8L37_00950, partial [Phycisphaerales bacterium]|nr:hypothetical protein [Phycisphaerales bacterium]